MSFIGTTLPTGCEFCEAERTPVSSFISVHLRFLRKLYYSPTKCAFHRFHDLSIIIVRFTDHLVLRLENSPFTGIDRRALGTKKLTVVCSSFARTHSPRVPSSSGEPERRVSRLVAMVSRSRGNEDVVEIIVVGEILAIRTAD